jgi:hypothetical protein
MLLPTCAVERMRYWVQDVFFVLVGLPMAGVFSRMKTSCGGQKQMMPPHCKMFKLPPQHKITKPLFQMSEDKPEEPEAPPIPVVLALSDLEELEFPPPNCEDFWNSFGFKSRLFQDPDPEPEPPRLIA